MIGEVYFEWDYFENGYFETVISNSISKRQFRKKFHGYFEFNFEMVISKKWLGTWSISVLYGDRIWRKGDRIWREDDRIWREGDSIYISDGS